MKKAILTFMIISMILLTASCFKSKNSIDTSNEITVTGSNTDTSTTQQSEASTTIPEPGPTPSTTMLAPLPKDSDVIKKESVDLDNDGSPEEITIYHVTSGKADNEAVEGRLRIEGKSVNNDFIFVKKFREDEGICSSVEFSDMDKDGAKDVFIIIPESGASFSLNYFYLYSAVKNKHIEFSVDNKLVDFASKFSFKYEGKGALQVTNTDYGFKAVMSLLDNANYSADDDEQNLAYERAWVEPSPVEIDSASKLSLAAQNNGDVMIKVPLPVFGQATVDMIGEIDLFYMVDESFSLKMKRFELYDFTAAGKVLAGSAEILK